MKRHLFFADAGHLRSRTGKLQGDAHVAGGPRVARRWLVGAVLAAAALAGCASVEPWVKPYERERLADPILQFSRDALPDRHREHVRVVREGARGATGVQGGGCGCN